MEAKQITLWEDEQDAITEALSAFKGKQVKNTIDDYDAFVEKFKSKKTTDDCYTPPEVYETVLRYVEETCGIEGRPVIRPFYPGKDYTETEYPAGCVVVDNPPFSILAQITRFYLSRGIEFFLFAPQLTLFSADLDCTRIVADADITYENGAKVKTSFLSNMFGDIVVLGDPYLRDELEKINEANKVNLPKYEYPLHVLTVSMVAKWVKHGVPFQVSKCDLTRIGGLDSQKPFKKSIFGNGYLLSEKAAAEKAAAEKAAAEKDNVIIWELSEREKGVIKELGK